MVFLHWTVLLMTGAMCSPCCWGRLAGGVQVSNHRGHHLEYLVCQVDGMLVLLHLVAKIFLH